MPFPANGENTKLGKGSLMLAKISNTGEENGFDFLGNVNSLTLSAAVTKAELYSSTQRSAPLLASDVTRVGYNLVATCNEYTKENLKKFLLGEEATKLQVVGAAVVVTLEDVIPGRFYDLGSRQITGVSAVGDGTEALVANVDYVLNTEFGVVQIVEGGLVAEGDDVAFTFNRPALTITQIRIAKDSAPKCHLLYLSDDANQDGAASRDRLEIWKVNTAPEGDLNFISDDHGSFQLSMSVLSDGVNHPADPFGTLDRIE